MDDNNHLNVRGRFCKGAPKDSCEYQCSGGVTPLPLQDWFSFTYCSEAARVLSQTFEKIAEAAIAGHSYAASAANC